MTTSGGDRWPTVQDALWAALQRTPATRQAYLTEAHAADPELLAEVRSLLQAHDQSSDFLGKPILFRSGSSTSEGTGPIRRLFEEIAARPDPLVGSTVAHYHVSEKLGEGGMGVVYKARDTRLDRIVALKFLPPHLDADEEATARLVREARAASALDHVNICTIHGIGETDAGQVFIAMACYVGETLETKMRREALSLDESLAYAMEVAQGLAAAHEQGLVHRDVKPANIMVTEDGVVKLLDFGLARAADVSLSGTAPLRATVAYMSPEQALGRTVDHRTDLWSLGVILYEMLADRRPFQGDDTRAVVHAILNDEPEPVVGPGTDMPAVLERVLCRTLAKRPAERYERIQDLIGDLQMARRSATESGTGSVVPATTRSGSTGAPPRGRLFSEGERVQVTVATFSLDGPDDDVRRGTPNHSDPVLSRIRDYATQVVHQRGGVVQRSDAGEVVAIFGAATPREDDCVQAARASSELHTWVRRQVEAGTVPEMRVSSGIDTGFVVVRRPGRGGRGHRIVGAPLQRAARLARHAGPDQILASPGTRRLLEPFFEIVDHGPLQWKGLAWPITPGRIVATSACRSRLEAADPAWLTPHVGRESEMETLRHGLQRAVAGEGQLVTVVGEAGLGKSRLLFEFRRALEGDGGGIVQGRCSSDGDLIPFQPFIEALRDHFSIGPRTPGNVGADRVVAGVLEVSPELQPYIPLYLHLLSLPGEAHPLPEHLKGEPLDRALLEALVAIFTLSARRAPLVLSLEDWHTSDRASRKVLDRLVELLPAYPLMVVVTFRPEYAPGWDHPAHQTTLRLRPLERGPSFAIMKSALHAAHLPEAVGVLLHERTGGNPFFIEEICHALEEEGSLEVEEGRVTGVRSMHGLRLPNTVQAVIRTRLHRLDRDARRVLGQAAVAGRMFTRELLGHALGEKEGASASLDASLDTLRGAGLIHQTHVLPETTYRFRHVLTREVAYDSLLPHQRQRMHGRMAEAIEARYADGLEEHAEALVHQFGEAKHWRKVVRYSRMAAERSYRFGQLPETVTLYERARTALERLPEGAERRETLIELLLRQERLYEEITGHEEQQATIDELFVLLDGVDDPETLTETHIRQGDLHVLQGRFAKAEDALDEALRVSRAESHRPGEQKALRSMGFLRWHQDRHQEAVSINEELVALDRQRGDVEPLVTDLLNFLTVLRRMKDFERGLVCVEELLVLSEQIDDPVRQLPLYNNIGEFYRGLGDHARALFYLDRALEIAEQNHYLGTQTYQLAIRAQILFEQGRIEESIQCYREAIGLHRGARFPIGAPGSAHANGPWGLAVLLRRLGELLVALQRDEEALPYLEEAAALADRLQDPETEALLRSKVAALHEGRERHPAAQVAWERVRDLCRGSGDVAGECRALEGLGRTARRQQDVDRALPRYREALRLAEQTGDEARQGELHNTLGILVWKRGAYAEALAHYEQALRIYEAREQLVHVGLMLNSIGATLQKLGRSEEAVGRLEEAIRLHRGTAQRQLEAYALGVLGDVHFGMGRHGEALSCYVASLGLRPDLGDRRGEGWMLHRMARVYAAQGLGARSRTAGRRAAAIAADIEDQELSETCRPFTGAAGV